MKNIALVVLHYGNPKITLSCLQFVEKLNTRGIKLSTIVVDNGGWAEEFTIPKTVATKLVEVVKTEKNLGYAGGMNIGFVCALAKGAEYVAVLNNDTRVDESLLMQLVRPFEKNKRVGITVPKIYFAPGSEFHEDRYKKADLGKVIWYAGGVMDWRNILGSNKGVDQVDTGQFEIEEETEIATGCCFMICAQVLNKVGMFNENYFMYYEDADLSVRVKRAGHKIIYTPQAFLWHKNAVSGGGSGSNLQDYYISRNRLLFGFSYGSVRAKAALLRESLKLLTHGRKWQRFGIRDYFSNNLGKGSFGLVVSEDA